jgi:hypothetical protein
MRCYSAVQHRQNLYRTQREERLTNREKRWPSSLFCLGEGRWGLEPMFLTARMLGFLSFLDSFYQHCRTLESFGSGSGSRQYLAMALYLAQVSNKKNLYKILPLQCQKRHYFQESYSLIFDFFYFLLYFMLSGSGSAKAKFTVPTFPVPQHCLV